MDDTHLQQRLGQQLRLARQRLRLTQREAAARAGLDAEIYGRFERGKLTPSVATFRRLARALETSTDTLLELTSKEQAPVEEDTPLAELQQWLPRLREWPPENVRVVVQLLKVLDGRVP